MTAPLLRVTYLGGPTALLEYGGLRFLTDPTLDPAGTEYPTPAYTLRKQQSPVLPPGGLGPVDAVLLSHDHHFDNLDHAGRVLLATAGMVCTTIAGAERLGNGARGLEAGAQLRLRAPAGGDVGITATPARHGPAGGDRGPCIGFLLESAAAGAPRVYVSGDTVWYDAIEAIGRGRRVDVALLNLGAAKVAVAGPAPLTFTADEAVALARAWPGTLVVPLHFEGWEHFTEGREAVRDAFAAAGLTARLRWLAPGVPTELTA